LKTKNIIMTIPVPHTMLAAIGAKTPNPLNDERLLFHVVPINPIMSVVSFWPALVAEPVIPVKKFAIAISGISSIHSISPMMKLTGLLDDGKGG